MASETRIRRLRNCYAMLLRLYPRQYRARFGEGMEQTFGDLCRERADAQKPMLAYALWMFVEAFAGILKENARVVMESKGIARVAFVTAIIMLIPLLGSIFVKGWKWGFFDFVNFGALVFGIGTAYQFLAAKARTNWYRAAVALALLTGFFLFWVNAAVGIIGDLDEANALYFVVLLIGIAGSALARFRPQGMARTLFVMAVAQALVPVIALALWSPQNYSWSPGVAPVFCLNAFFVLLFACSALLFRRAGRRETMQATSTF